MQVEVKGKVAGAGVWWVVVIAACGALDWLTTWAILSSGGFEADQLIAHLLTGPLWWPLLVYKAILTIALVLGAVVAQRFTPQLTRVYMAAAVVVAAAAPVWNLAQLGMFLLAHL